MAAPKGNDFWKQRARHGREKIFSTPDELWDAACEYFQWAIDNPLNQAEPIKSGELAGTCMSVEKMRPFSISGMLIFFGTSNGYWRKFRAEQKDNDEFFTVIQKIEAVIWTQKFEGAATGLLQPNIIAMELGLKQRTDVTTDDEKIGAGIDLSKLSYEQLIQLSGDDQKSGESGTGEA